MRALLTSLILVAVTLAGCARQPADVPDATDMLAQWQPGKNAHPSHGLPLPEELPMWNEPLPDNWPTFWVQPPPADLPDIVERLVHEGNVAEVGSGSGITVFGSLLFAGQWNGANLWAVDISDPDQPRVIGHLEGETSAGDLDTIAFAPSEEHPEGRLILTISTRGQNINIVDATDPTNMAFIGSYQPAQGNHNHQVLPGTPYVYNAQSGGEGGVNAIWDLSDPENPVHVVDYANGYGCHAIDFFIDAEQDKFLGFCAGIEVTQIWDVTDPTSPEVISTVPFPVANTEVDGASGAVAPASFSHLAMANHDGTILIMGDETGGGAAPGCDFGVRDPVTGTAVSGPLGNLYFYDMTDPTDPILHGSVSPNAFDQKGSCTAHFGGNIDGRNQLVMAYYTVGVVLINFEDIDNPYVQDIWGRTENDQPCTLCGVWDAQVYGNRVFTGDIDRGVDVLTFA